MLIVIIVLKSCMRGSVIKQCVDFIISDTMLAAGDKEELNRLYKEIVGKDWFMALLDLKAYINVKEQALADYEDHGMGQETAYKYCQCRFLLIRQDNSRIQQGYIQAVIK